MYMMASTSLRSGGPKEEWTLGEDSDRHRAVMVDEKKSGTPARKPISARISAHTPQDRADVRMCG